MGRAAYDPPVTPSDLVAMAAMCLAPVVLGAGLVLSVLAVARAPRNARPMAFVALLGVSALVMVAGAGLASWAWGVGFDYADSLRQVPAGVDRTMVLGSWSAVGGYLGVVMTGAAASVARRRSAS